MLAEVLSTEHPDLSPELREELLASWTTWWDPLRDSLLAEPPPRRGSIAETRAVVSFYRGLRGTPRLLGDEFQSVLGSGFEKALFELVEQEKTAGSSKRKLELRYLEAATTTLLDLVLELRYAGLDEADFASVAVNLDEGEAGVALDPSVRGFLGLELAVLLCLDLLRTSSDDDALFEWARRARLWQDLAKPVVLQIQRTPPGEMTSDIVLSVSEYRRAQELLEESPTPSRALRELLRHGD